MGWKDKNDPPSLTPHPAGPPLRVGHNNPRWEPLPSPIQYCMYVQVNYDLK